MAEVVGSPNIHSSTWEHMGVSASSKVSVVSDHARNDASLSLRFTVGNLMGSKNFAGHNANSNTS